MPAHERLAPVTRSALPVLLLLASAAPALPQGGAPPVDVVAVRKDRITTTARFVGTVEPVKRAVIGSAVDGRVEKLFVNEGDRVGSGDEGRIAQILTSTIELEKKAAEAELRLRKEEVAELQAGTRPEEKRRVKAQMAAAAAAREYAKANLDRTERLFRNGTATSDAFESARSAFAAADELFNERKAAHELAEIGPREETKKQAEARRDLQAAMVEKLSDQINKYTVRSRFPGYVVAEHTEEGAWVKSGDPVAEVVYLDEVDVLVHVLETQIRHVRRGEKVRIEIPALPDEVFVGEIVHVVPQADTRTRTFPVKVRLENVIEEGVPVVKSGMLARVLLPTGGSVESHLVPKDALVLGGPKPVVFVADKSEGATTVRPVPVELGGASGPWIAVTGDLVKGQHVVVRGNERVRPGQPVSPRVVQVDAGDETTATPDAD